MKNEERKETKVSRQKRNSHVHDRFEIFSSDAEPITTRDHIYKQSFNAHVLVRRSYFAVAAAVQTGG